TAQRKGAEHFSQRLQNGISLHTSSPFVPFSRASFSVADARPRSAPCRGNRSQNDETVRRTFQGSPKRPASARVVHVSFSSPLTRALRRRSAIQSPWLHS